MVQTASDSRAFLGHSSRRVQGVRIRPMKYTPASVFSGNGTATSPARMPNSSSAIWFSVRVGGRGERAPSHTVPRSKWLHKDIFMSIYYRTGLLSCPTDWEMSHYECADRLR